MERVIVAQYAKWPELGKVKTRIAKMLNDQEALRIHMELVETVMRNIRAADFADYQLWTSCLPEQSRLVDSCIDASTRAQSEKLLEIIGTLRLDCCVQAAGDLGDRMTDTFKQLASDYSKIVIVGSDCPLVDRQMLQAVMTQLDKVDVVLTPAEDGGYVLLAIREQAISKIDSRWLDGVEWGTEMVLSQTIKCCERQSLSYFLMPESWDVDELVDYQRWIACEGER